MKRLTPLLMWLLPLTAYPQVISKITMDTTQSTHIGHVAIGAFVDSYYGYNFNKPASNENAYFVSSSRNNDITINLAYIDVQYRSTNMRARFIPGFGTYMDANYKNEPGSLKYLVQASAGVRLFKNVWLDVGVMGSPFTNETAISKDQLMYTRSFAPENVPYYVSGARLTFPLSSKVNYYLWVLNGWQNIQETNNNKSINSQFEFTPSKDWLLNWNFYVGNEESTSRPDFRIRYFNDFYAIYKPADKKFSATSCFYVGYQERNNASTAVWWQANAIGKYNFTNVFALSGRVEYFNDPQGVIYANDVNGNPGFRTASAGVCANFQLHQLTLLRFEARQFFSPDQVYQGTSGSPRANEFMLVGSLAAWF